MQRGSTSLMNSQTVGPTALNPRKAVMFCPRLFPPQHLVDLRLTAAKPHTQALAFCCLVLNRRDFSILRAAFEVCRTFWGSGFITAIT